MRPQANEAFSSFHGYISKVSDDDIVSVLERQLDETVAFLSDISEERSLHRYQPDKWSMRELLGHVNDCERVFVYRALWFARGFEEPLPSFDQEISVAGSNADEVDWANHIAEFRAIRLATISFFRNLPAENLEDGLPVWNRTGIANGNLFTVRALAYIIAGHLEHHMSILKDRYV